jgi:DNA gyrase subunit A
VNLLQLDKEESIKSIISVDAYEDTHHLLFVTSNGIVKRVRIKEFENIRQNGKIAVTLKENDQLYAVKKTDGTEEVLIASSGGKVVRFDEEEVRCMGRSAAGVIGINLDEGEAVVGVTTSLDGSYILAITQKGYGKMSLREDYRLTKRGGKGVKTVNVTDKNGKLVGMRAVSGEEDLLVTTNKGIIIRISLTQVKIAGRNTQGVRLIRLDEDQEVASIAVTEGTQEE